MSPNESPAVRCAAALVDSLVSAGVRDFVLAPGSRSAPLALCVADRERRGLLRLHVQIDERSAGFFALGLSRGTDRAVALICTSGSAVANLAPAAVEADYSSVPLILLTADRPPELRGVGAAQTIDQSGWFSGSVRASIELHTPATGDVAECEQWVAEARGAVEISLTARGPVHLNVAFRAPLVGAVPDPADQRAAPLNPVLPNSVTSGPETLGLGRTDSAASGSPKPSSTADSDSGFPPRGPSVPDEEQIRGLLVVGDLPVPGIAAEALISDIHMLAEQLSWPVIAEPTARLQESANLIHHGPLLADCPPFVAGRPVEFVVTVGRVGLTRAIWNLVSGARIHWAVSVDGRGQPADPGRTAELNLDHPPTTSQIRQRWQDESSATPRDLGQKWLAGWQSADAQAGAAVLKVLDSSEVGGGVSGAQAATTVWNTLAADDTLFVAASWPIRYLNSLAGSGGPGRVVANRGVNGIDGLVSTALGLAAGVESDAAMDSGRNGADGPVEELSYPPTRTVAVVGDLAFLHDIGGLVGASDRNINLVLVILDNNGGGIFSQLEQGAPEYSQDFERVFGTPHNQDLAALTRAMGIHTTEVIGSADLADAVRSGQGAGGVRVVLVRTESRASEARLLTDITAAACQAIQNNEA